MGKKLIKITFLSFCFVFISSLSLLTRFAVVVVEGEFEKQALARLSKKSPKG
jgi:hypothetical protein